MNKIVELFIAISLISWTSTWKQKRYITMIMVALSILYCSKKEEGPKLRTKKGFELSNTMLKSISLAKVEKKNIENDYNFYGKISADKNSYIVCAIMNIHESDIDKIGLGMKVQVSILSYPDKVFAGKIDKIFKSTDPQTNTVHARVVLDNANGLFIPESKATIKVLSLENNTALTVPTQAVIFDDNRSFVVIYKSRTDVKVKEIKVLKRVGDITYVSEGLSEGEEVITNNQLLIYRSLNS